ncbi:MAG: cytochrome c oxidase subunit 3 [Gammaproteobacteria bacterium]|nr:cytochrome c oxidase subunit 3 [Gammaproteobacteria bacterium]
MEPIHPLGLPLLNTVVLLSSGVSGTFAHMAMQRRDTRNEVIHGLLISVIYGILFTCLQL